MKSYSYIVTKEGVYRHDILGIFTSKKAANDHADVCSQAEEDDYHNFLVAEYEVDHPYMEEPDGNIVSSTKLPGIMFVIPFKDSVENSKT